MTTIQLTKAEIQSGLSRVKWAEGLIRQLPTSHKGRNSWLLNYGTSLEAQALRDSYRFKVLVWNPATESAVVQGDPGIPI